jgi:hypothetical protein
VFGQRSAINQTGPRSSDVQRESNCKKPIIYAHSIAITTPRSQASFRRCHAALANRTHAIRAADWLCLAATPAFAIMAVLTLVFGDEMPVMCSAGSDAFAYAQRRRRKAGHIRYLVLPGRMHRG